LKKLINDPKNTAFFANISVFVGHSTPNILPDSDEKDFSKKL